MFSSEAAQVANVHKNVSRWVFFGKNARSAVIAAHQENHVSSLWEQDLTVLSRFGAIFLSALHACNFTGFFTIKIHCGNTRIFEHMGVKSKDLRLHLREPHCGKFHVDKVNYTRERQIPRGTGKFHADKVNST